jgi:hypothetical protein
MGSSYPEPTLLRIMKRSLEMIFGGLFVKVCLSRRATATL